MGRADARAVPNFQALNGAFFAPTSPVRQHEFLTESCGLRQAVVDRDEAEAGRAVRLFVFPRGDDPVVIGHVALTNIVRGVAQFCDLAYAISHDHEGRGLMAEAVGATIRFAFDDLGLHRICAAYLPTNERNGGVLRRLGFVVEGYARDYLMIQGRWQDMILVGLVSPAWRQSG